MPLFTGDNAERFDRIAVYKSRRAEEAKGGSWLAAVRVSKSMWGLGVLVLFAGMADAAESPDEAAERSTVPSDYELAELFRPPPTTADPGTRESFTAMVEAVANDSFDEADIAAKRAVELVNSDAPDAQIARARALHNLAIVQQYMGENESAKQNYQAVLSMYSSATDNLSPDLILPLRGLAIAHLDSGDPQAAIAAIERAVHVSNVNDGPHSLQQLPILNDRMQIYFDSDDANSAVKTLDRIYGIYTRKFPKQSREMLPALYQRTEIFDSLNMHGYEYRAWRHILEIKSSYLAENDTELIEPHMQIAQIHIRDLRKTGYRHVTTSPAERHLRKALWIAENSTESDWEVKKDCLISLADFYTLFDLKGRARRYYARAWELMSSNDEYVLARNEDFGAPVPLAQPRVEPYAKFEYHRERPEPAKDDFVGGEMTLAFTVDDRGRTRNLRIVEAEPAGFTQMELRAQKLVKDFVYRPRYVDGAPVDTEDQTHTIEYFYLPDEYQAALDEAAKPRSPWQSRKD